MQPSLRFTKMHGCGNDYVFVDCVSQPINLDWPRVARILSDRHFGIGSDGLILILPSEKADFRMRMFNADGSEGEMCGNGMRCLAKYVYEHGLTSKVEFEVETLAGIIRPRVLVELGHVKEVEVDMGSPQVGRESTMKLDDACFEYTPVSMGNPHCVIFYTDPGAPEGVDVGALGPRISHAGPFPNGTNVEFARVLGADRIRVRVWERGTGETLACGTGACAVAAAAVHKGLCDRTVTVELRGGTLTVKLLDNGHAMLRGPAVEVFSGQISEELWREIHESC